MAKQFTIAPSILAADFACLQMGIETAETCGAGIIHIDVMDGHFVPNLTMGPVVVEACRRITQLPLEVHLMIESPERHLAAFAKAGANRILVHVETCPNLHRTLGMVRELGCSVGVVLNPATPAVMVEPVLSIVDEVLVMTVNPGYGGQHFIPETLAKIAKIRGLLDSQNPSAEIEVDGGVTAETLPPALEAGAQIFVAGTAVFKHPEGIAGGMQALLACLPRS